MTKEGLTLAQLVKNAEKVLGRKHFEDRSPKVLKYFAQPGVKVFRVNAKVKGASGDYDLNINFQNVSFSETKDAKHFLAVPTSVEGKRSEQVYMEQLDYNKHTVKVWCSCIYFRFACFTGDTLIPLLNGISIPIKNLTGRTKFYVYSYDLENNKKVVGEASNCRLVQQNAKIIKVILDNGKEIKCTPDHKFLLSNGEYVEAKDLKEGDSLKALYRKVSDVNNGIDGYEMYEENGSWKYTHYMSDKFNEDNKLPGSEVLRHGENDPCLGWERHHLDEEKRNNLPSNIQRVTRNKHYFLHSLSEESRERCSERMIVDNPMKDSKVAKKVADKNRKNGLFKRIGKKFAAWAKSKEGREKLSTIKKEKIANGEIDISKSLAKMQQIHKERLQKGEHHWQTEEHRERVKKSNQEKIKNGTFIFQRLNKDNEFIYKHHPKSLKLKEWLDSLPEGKNEIPKTLSDKIGYSGIWAVKDALELVIKREEYPAKVTRNLGHSKGNFVIKYPKNHKVVKIEDAGYENVYCFEVKDYHNFAIDVDGGINCSSGIFVHNCEWYLHQHNSLFARRKPRPYTKVPGSTRPSVNPEHLPCVCKHLFQLANYLKNTAIMKS